MMSSGHKRTFEICRLFLGCYCAHSKWPPNTKCVTISAQDQFSEVKSSQARFWKPSTLSQQVLVRVVNDLLIRSLSRFSAQDQFSEVQSSQAHLWKPPSFCSAVTRARSKWPPNTECVTIFYTRSVQWGTILTSTLLKTTDSFSAVTCARSKWPPNTECVTIFYKRSVQWGTILTSALFNHRVFLGSYLCA